MRELFACVLGSACIIGAAASISPANASTAAVCYNPWSQGGSTPTAGPVCGDIAISGTNMQVQKDPLQFGPNVQLSGVGGGNGVGALVSVAGSFGSGHIKATSFTPAQNGSDFFIANAQGYTGTLDRFTVRGTTDANVQVTNFIEGSADEGGEGHSALWIEDLTTNQFVVHDMEANVYSFQPTDTRTQLVTLSAGHQFELSWSMEAIAIAKVDFFTNQPSASADLSNTGHAFLDDLTPGTSLVFDSGHDYSTNALPVAATPLPSSLGMMLIGACGFGFAAARRRSHGTTFRAA